MLWITILKTDFMAHFDAIIRIMLAIRLQIYSQVTAIIKVLRLYFYRHEILSRLCNLGHVKWIITLGYSKSWWAIDEHLFLYYCRVEAPKVSIWIVITLQLPFCQCCKLFCCPITFTTIERSMLVLKGHIFSVVA